METLRKPVRKLLAVAVLHAFAAHAIAAPIQLIPSGPVQVRFGNESWENVTGPTDLIPGQTVRTQGEGQALIKFSDGSRVQLSRWTSFVIEKTDTKEASFKLEAGKLRAAIAGYFSNRYKIRTPTAVASVRGTEFEIEAKPGKTEMNVAEGLLEVSDNKGKEAVVSSEETVTIGENGMQPVELVGLSDNRAQDAARPIAVLRESANDATRSMVEELRNRELKANEAQLGKDAIDAFGQRVRIEEYILRPANNELKFIFLTHRDDSLNWGHMIQRFNSRIPNDYSLIPEIVNRMYFSRTAPSNWLTYFEVYVTNTIDAVKEAITFGAPTAINFNGFGGIGTRYFPVSIEHNQVLSGPGVPGGERTQFRQTMDYSIITPGAFTVRQFVPNSSGALTLLAAVSLNPANAANVQAGGSVLYFDSALDAATVTTTSFPSGRDRADFKVETTYADGSTLSSRKILVSNEGDILSFGNVNSDTFNKEGSYNFENVIESSFFQGRKIDVLIAPEIFAQKKTATTTADNFQPN